MVDEKKNRTCSRRWDEYIYSLNGLNSRQQTYDQGHDSVSSSVSSANRFPEAELVEARRMLTGLNCYSPLQSPP